MEVGEVMKQKPKDSMWTDEQWEAVAVRNSNVLVSAGAGSGKTAVLSERVLELVKEGVAINDLIVLTFTNAAAAEMKSRIRTKLLNAGEKDPWVKENGMNIDGSFITTFDSYCLHLVKKYHYLLGVSKQISIIDNPILNELKRSEMAALIEEQVALENVHVINLLELFTATSSSEIERVLIEFHNKYKQDMNPNVSIDPEQLFTTFEGQIEESLLHVKGLFKEIEIIAADTNMPEKIEERLSLLLNSSGYESIRAGIEVVMEKRFWQVPRKDFDGKEEVKKINDELKSELKKIAQMCMLGRNEHIEMLVKINDFKKTINGLIVEFDMRLHKRKLNLGLFEFIDINLFAIQLLKENDDIASELRRTVYEIMIDEYQDTNDIQEEFVKIIGNNNVYMVGDIKQSIYGFRNANPKLFAEKFNNYQNGNGGKLITLTNNFRSRENLLKQVNNYFKSVMSEQYGGIEYDASQVMNYGNKTYEVLKDINDNEIIYYDEDEISISKNDFEIMQIFKDIDSKMKNKCQVVDGKQARDVILSDFAIICNTREMFERIVEIGQYYNISVRADINEKFISSEEVIVLQAIFTIVNAVKVNADDDQRLLFNIIVLARSFLFDYSDEQIDQTMDMLLRIKQGEVSKILYALERSELSKMASQITSVTNNIEYKTNEQILFEVLNIFNILEKLVRLKNPLTCQLRISKLTDLICDFDKQGLKLTEVVNYLQLIQGDSDLDIEFSALPDQTTDSVTVITTHKSKGLEYNICYFPFLDKQFNMMDIRSRMNYSFNTGAIMPGIISGSNLTDSIEKKLFKQESVKETISERIRLFYVAITRAKDRNILIVNKKKIDGDKIKPIAKSNTLIDLIGSGYQTLIEYEKKAYELNDSEIVASERNDFSTLSGEKTNAVEKMFEYQELAIESTTFEKFRASGSVDEILSAKDKTAINTGNEVHAKLEFCDLLNIDHEIDKASGQLKLALSNIKKSKLVEAAINIYPEFQFNMETEMGEVNGIIDLLVETNDSFIIVDYKLSNIDKDSYDRQVGVYCDYISTMSNKKIEGYLLSLIGGNVRRVR